jgi:S-adenosylmethionine-diacylglycerol 3-amino-3-carboxypropyl transferase
VSVHLHKVDHGYIRYANCWEDADLLVEALDVREGHRVLSIASAGDNSFSLLMNAPELVLAVDINPVQLQLVELKKAAITALDQEDFLRFMGFRPSADRLRMFPAIMAALPVASASYWEQRKEMLADGLIDKGKFENYFRLFRTRVLPLVHGRTRIAELLLEKSADEQERFYDRRWNNWRWRLLFRIFFSRFMMGRLGRDPAFLAQVDVNVGDFIFQRAERHLRSAACQRNEFLEFIKTGTFHRHLPHYARKENYDRIRANVHRLVTFKGLAEDAFQEYGGFHRFNLSNIFEYMPMDVFAKVTRDIVDHAGPGARLAYWNLMVPRRMSTMDDRLLFMDQLSASLTERDKGFFYRAMHVDVKR